MKAPLNTRPTVLNDAAHVSRTYRLKVPRGVALEDVLDPIFWSHVAVQMCEFDLIEIMAEDKSWWGLFLVVSAGTREARLMQLAYAEGQARKPVGEPDAKVVWRAARKFSLVRIADGDIIEEDIATKEEAEERLALRMKSA